MRRVSFGLAIGIFGIMVPAAADTLTLHNCTQGTLHLSTFNEGDGVCWVPRTKRSLASCGTVTFTCDGKCKVKGMSGSGVNLPCGNLPRLNGENVIPKYWTGEQYLKTVGRIEISGAASPKWRVPIVRMQRGTK